MIVTKFFSGPAESAEGDYLMNFYRDNGARWNSMMFTVNTPLVVKRDQIQAFIEVANRVGKFPIDHQETILVVRLWDRWHRVTSWGRM